MPEGHVIHRIARDHTKDFVGLKTLLFSPQGRFEEEASLLSGRKLKSIEANGKHLFYCWTGGHTVHVHLGLYGKFRPFKLPAPEPRGQVRVRLIGKEKGFDLNGPNACHLLDKQEIQAIFNRLGPDPLREDSDPERAWERITKSRSPIGTMLLNQEVIAGVGNIYRAEILYLMQIDPRKPGKELAKEQFEELWKTLQSLLKIGVRYNKILIADPNEIGKPRSRMTRQESLLVYKKKHCMRCRHRIRSWQLGARTVYACLECQT